MYTQIKFFFAYIGLLLVPLAAVIGASRDSQSVAWHRSYSSIITKNLKGNHNLYFFLLFIFFLQNVSAPIDINSRPMHLNWVWCSEITHNTLTLRNFIGIFLFHLESTNGYLLRIKYIFSAYLHCLLRTQQCCHTKRDNEFLCKHGQMNWKRSNGVA